MELTREQAQAIADAITSVDSGYFSANAIDILEARFPDFDWWSLLDEGMADPRPAVPRAPVDPEKLNASLRTYAESVRRQLDRSTSIFGGLG